MDGNLLPGALDALNKKLAYPVTELEVYIKISDIIFRPYNYSHLFFKTITNDYQTIKAQKPELIESEKWNEQKIKSYDDVFSSSQSAKANPEYRYNLNSLSTFNGQVAKALHLHLKYLKMDFFGPAQLANCEIDL